LYLFLLLLAKDSSFAIRESLISNNKDADIFNQNTSLYQLSSSSCIN